MRKIQYDNVGNNIWCYYIKNTKNPCECGSNCYHQEYDNKERIIYCVCNSCKKDIYVIRDEYIQEELKKGEWR